MLGGRGKRWAFSFLLFFAASSPSFLFAGVEREREGGGGESHAKRGRSGATLRQPAGEGLARPTDWHFSFRVKPTVKKKKKKREEKKNTRSPPLFCFFQGGAKCVKSSA